MCTHVVPRYFNTLHRRNIENVRFVEFHPPSPPAPLLNASLPYHTSYMYIYQYICTPHIILGIAKFSFFVTLFDRHFFPELLTLKTSLIAIVLCTYIHIYIHIYVYVYVRYCIFLRIVSRDWKDSLWISLPRLASRITSLSLLKCGIELSFRRTKEI